MFFQVIRFHKPDEENGFMSNWYMNDFTVYGTKYNCVEQYMMAEKARVFQDFAITEQIMQSNDPQKMQDMGRLVNGFEPIIWGGRKQLIVYQAVYAKFDQNPELAGQLISTGTALPVECSRSDRVWGIGLGMDDPDVANPQKWRGQNLLGFTLQAVRTELMHKYIRFAAERLDNKAAQQFLQG